MCDTVIDEHFRRSLGNNYMELFDKGTAAVTPPNGSSSPPGVPVTVLPAKRAVSPPAPVAAPPPKKSHNVSVSVDDHFAKALGETWNKLKATQGKQEEEDELGDEEEDIYTSEDEDEEDLDDLSSEEEDLRKVRGRSNGSKFNNNNNKTGGRR